MAPQVGERVAEIADPFRRTYALPRDTPSGRGSLVPLVRSFGASSARVRGVSGCCACVFWRVCPLRVLARVVVVS